MRRFPIHFALMLTLFATIAPVMSATTYNGPPLFTLPAKTPKTEVACTTCVPSSLLDKKSVGYQGAISTFVGRYNDSALDSEGFSLPRPLRAWQMKYNAAHNRLYMRIGSYLVAYDVPTLLSRLNANEPLITIDRPGDVGPAGSYLSWDKFFNVEENWPQSGLDGGDWLPDFDFDDRGFLYLTEGVAWGSVKDDFARGGQFSDGYKFSASSARSIVALKASNGHYYVVVSPETGSSVVFDVTDRSAPVSSGTITRSWVKTAVAKSADGHWVAIANSGTNVIEIFTTEDFITNRPPTFSTPAGQIYKGVTTDGVNFYSAESASGGKLSISVFTSSGGSFTEQKYRTQHGFLPERLQFGAGYVSVSGLNTSNATNDIHVFRVASGNLTELDLNVYTTGAAKSDRYLPSYYSPNGVPTGYLSSIYSLIFDSLVYQRNGKTYLFVNAKGLGDVYEIKGSDSVSATNKGVTGTPNPNSGQTSAGPFYGDKIVFGSSTSAPAQMNVNWNFGNPEASDNTAASTTGADVVHQYSGLTATSQLASSRIVTVTNAVDTSITDSQSVTLAVPSPRVGIVGQAILFTSPNASSSAAIVTSDLWKDTSDGTIEGHYSSWNIDGTTTKALPNATVPVGGCGTHSLIFTANYGPYSGSGSTLASTNGALAQSINSINYTARPFAAIVTGPAASGGADIAFSSASRATSDTAIIPNGTQFTWTWDLLNSSGASIQTATGTSNLSAIPNFVVPRTTFTGLSGVKVRLVLSTNATLPGACAGLTTSSVTNDVPPAPNPHINKLSGCQYSGSPCNLSVTSSTGADTSGWTVNWTFSPASVVGGSGLTFSPSFTNTYSGQVTATATNAIGSGSDTMALSIATPPCNNPPTQGDIVVQYSGSGGCSIGSTCTANTSIRFAASGSYKFNANCDTYLWTFGDGSTASTQIANHTYASNGTYTGNFKITVGSTTLTYPFTVSVGTQGGGNGCGNNCPPPPCPQISQDSVVTYFTAPSGCSSAIVGVPCAAGETVSFQASPNTFAGYNFSCGTHTFTWNYGDGGSGTGQFASHAYANGGTYNASVTVNSPTGTLSFPVNVTVAGAGGGGCTAPTTSNMTIALTGGTSGCSSSNPNCRASESIAFNVTSNTGYNFNACSHTFNWTFGDGQSGSGQQATHSYGTAQQYTVQVVVTNSSGSTTLTKLIAVNNANTGGGSCPAPTSSNVYLSYLSPNGGGCSSASPSAPCTPNEALSFAVNASGYSIGCGTHTYAWSFDDGGSSNSRTPTHAFTAARTYNVSCTITNTGGSTTLNIPVIVGTGSGGGPDVQVDFAYEPVPGAPTLIKFTPSVVPANSVSSWKWNFGDNSAEVPISGTSVIPQYHQYANNGTFTVVLTTNAGVVTKQVVVGANTSPRARPIRH